MSRLLLVEMRRAVKRRAFRWIVLLFIAGLAIAAITIFFQSSKTTTDRVAFGENTEAILTDCMKGQGDFHLEGGSQEEVAEFCSQIARDMAGDDRFFFTDFQDYVGGLGVFLIVISWLIGGSFIGAEWGAGTVGTLLTWDPRRTLVHSTKMIAIVIVTAVAALSLMALFGLMLLPAGSMRGTFEGIDATWAKETLLVALRASLSVGLGAAFGFSLGSVARNTGFAVGAGFVYIAILENLIRGFLPDWSRWLIADNLAVLLVDSEAESFVGHGPTKAAFILIAYVFIGGLASTALFKARDVS